jgi:hypothetical protein
MTRCARSPRLTDRFFWGQAAAGGAPLRFDALAARLGGPAVYGTNGAQSITDPRSFVAYDDCGAAS